MIFKIIEIQKNIEEAKLHIGNFVESIFKGFVKQVKKYGEKSLNHKNTSFFAVLLAMLINIYCLSIRDIGFNSAINFTDLNSNLDPITLIISGQILTNLAAILSIFISYKILKRSKLDQVSINLLVISFAIGFFLRIYNLQFGEFFVASSLILILFFPYLSMQLVYNKIFCPINYLILPFIIFILYLFSIYPTFANFEIYQTAIMPLIILIILSKEYNKIFLLMGIFSSIMLILSNKAYFDSISLFYALNLPYIFFILRKTLKKINFQKDWLFLLAIFFISQFEYSIFKLLIDIGFFWWIFSIIIALRWTKRKIKPHGFIEEFFLVKQWFYFILALVGSILISLQQELYQFAWAISILIFITLLIYHQKFYQRYKNTDKFSRLYSSAITLIFSFFCYLILMSIFNYKNQGAYVYSSPNKFSEEIINNTKNIEYHIISDKYSDTWPIAFYQQNKISEYGFNLEKNQLIIIKNYQKPCQTSFLENALRNKLFREKFINNYKFVNRIIISQTIKNDSQFYKDETKFLENENIIKDFEIYTRK